MKETNYAANLESKSTVKTILQDPYNSLRGAIYVGEGNNTHILRLFT